MTATMDEDKEECGCGWCVEVGEEALLARGRGDGVVIVLFLVILLSGREGRTSRYAPPAID
jgi:hypothetical protein